jgi:hypothetical protein
MKVTRYRRRTSINLMWIAFSEDSHGWANETSVAEIKYGSCVQMDRLLTEQSRVLCKLSRAQSYFNSKQIWELKKTWLQCVSLYVEFIGAPFRQPPPPSISIGNKGAWNHGDGSTHPWSSWVETRSRITIINECYCNTTGLFITNMLCWGLYYNTTQ